jgi:hypothetical protein
MLIQVIRHTFNANNTIGRMLINGKFFAHTCEDVVRTLKSQNDKVKGKTAISYGRYELDVTFSNRFQKELPILLAVPFFDGIRIHGGNTEADTDGCILIGANTDEKKIWNCGGKVASLVAQIKIARLTEKVFFDIKPEFS